MMAVPSKKPASRAISNRQDASTWLREVVLHVSEGRYKNNQTENLIEAMHVQAHATLKAAELVAAAIDRNTQALRGRAKTPKSSPEVK